jgi:phosphopantothenoylcysteine decarboxylase/phosphopantothenate--cysteine ligase
MSAAKVKKDEAADIIRLEPNPDILGSLGGRKEGRTLIGFAAETESVVDNARKKLRDKSLDLVVANDVSDPSIGFASDDNAVILVSEDDQEGITRRSKRALAAVICDRLAVLRADV